MKSGGQVRVPPRLQVLHLRDVVDSPGHHSRDRRSGPHHPDPGPLRIETIKQADPHCGPLVQELGREPTSEEIAKRMDIPVSKVRKVLKIAPAHLARNARRRKRKIRILGRFHRGPAQVVSPAEAVINLNTGRSKTESVLENADAAGRESHQDAVRRSATAASTPRGSRARCSPTRERIRQIEAKAVRQAAPSVAKPASCAHSLRAELRSR